MASRAAGEKLAHDVLVLVVEDEAILALDLEIILMRHGCRVLGPAATVDEALHLLRTETPDVALLDVNVRGRMVTPVAEELRARHVPFVLASAYERFDGAMAALDGVPNVGKPTSERRLMAALSEALRS